MSSSNNFLKDKQKREFENYQRVIACKDLVELMNQFNFKTELQKQYQDGINFAPDKETYITNTIKTLEENINKRKSGINYSQGRHIELGKYAGIGFAWVNNGYNATQQDFITMTQSNLSINAELPQEKKYLIYYILLSEIARGAVTAFHVSFLKDQLKLYMNMTSNLVYQKYNHQLPNFELLQNDRIWLTTIYNSAYKNKRLKYEQIKSLLDKEIPRSYEPEIAYELMNTNGEEITLLGIIAIEGNENVLLKCDKIIKSLQDLLIDEPELREIALSKIAAKALLPENEVGLLLLLIYRYIRFFSTCGTKTKDYYGCEFIHIDHSCYKEIMRFDSMKVSIMKSLRKTVAEEAEEIEIENKVQNQPTLATQVLAIYFLLKQCGVNPTDHQASVSRFIQFVTGREQKAKRIQDTSIFKHVTQPFKSNDKAVIKDLQTILPLFTEMEIEKIVDEIDKEIRHSQKNLAAQKPSKMKKSG